MITQIPIIAIIAFILISHALGYAGRFLVEYPSRIAHKNMQSLLKYYRNTWLIESGSTYMYHPDPTKIGQYFSYTIESLDGGETWYARDKDSILRPIKELYPGLLEHNKAWNEIKEYVKLNGQLTPGDDIALKLMKNAGLEFVKKEPPVDPHLEEYKAHLKNADFIKAIKTYKDYTGNNLRTSKEYIDELKLTMMRNKEL